MSTIKHHVFSIEGADNVGKSTLIETMKGTEEYRDKIRFTKYPIADMGNSKGDRCIKMMNISNNLLNYIKSEKESGKNAYGWFDGVEEAIIRSQMTNMLYQMITGREEILSDSVPNFTISDRGILSTYLYQYTDERCKLYNSNLTEVGNILEYTGHIYCDIGSSLVTPTIRQCLIKNATCIHNILLYNNSDNVLSNDKQEEVEYKASFDANKKLQSRVETHIDRLVKECEDAKSNSISYGRPTEYVLDYCVGDGSPLLTVIPINLFDYEGVRKTTHRLGYEVSRVIEQYLKPSINYINMK